MGVQLSFDDVIDAQDDLGVRRRRLERNILKLVVVLVVVGIGNAALNYSALQSVISWFSPTAGSNATILFLHPLNGNNLSQISSMQTPVFNNTFIRFNVSFSDEDIEAWHMLYVCNTSDSNYTLVHNGMVYNFTCGGRHQLCNSSNRVLTTDNPLVCDFYVSGWANQTQNFTAFIIDTYGNVGFDNSTFVVNRPPKIVDVSIAVI